ncbi:MAG: hypothetical protein LBJ63_03120, partial [Prevotellaceae bacterium]|nr:hypothetical protein [Prevotellaceae bacterium]
KENLPFTTQSAFYQDKFGTEDGQYAYVENVFEPSPLNRIAQTYNVGAVFRDEDKKSINYYSTNVANEVFLMNVNQANGNVTVAGYYAPNMLYKNSTTNEDGQTVITLTDKLGQTILTRTKDDNDQNFDTYYVYDDFGLLVMVIPPEYSSSIGINTSLSPGSAMVARYCYTYKYDGRGNMIERQMPGKEAEYMVYDKDDRLVMMQDGNMRQNNQWIYNVYDNVGNLTDKTLVKTNLTRSQIQAKYFAFNFHNDYTSLGESSSIYVPFGGDGFTEEHLVQSVRYYGKSYYVRNDLAPGTYLRYNPFTLIPMSSVEEDDETVSSIDLQAIKKPSVPITDPTEPIDPPTDPPGGGGGGGYLPVDPDPDPNPLPDPCLDCDPQHLYTTGLFAIDIKGNVSGSIFIKNTYLYCVDPNNPNIKYYTIPTEYMSIAECLALCSRTFAIFEGIPGGIQTAEWKRNPSSLAFEPVVGVCEMTDLDSVKVKHLKAYEKLKILTDDGDFVERAFYYDRYGRVIQTVEKNHLGYISRYSTKYDFVGNVLAQHESHKTSSTATDIKLTLFTYDERGRLLAEAATVNGSDTAKVAYKYNELGQQIAKVYDNNLITDSTKYNIQGWITEKTARQGADNVFDMKLNYYSPTQANTTPSYTGNITEWTWRHESADVNTYAFEYDKLSRLTESLMYTNNMLTNAFTEQNLTYDKNGNIKTLKRYGETNLINDITCSYSGNRLWTVNQMPAYWYDANGNMNKDYRKNLDFTYNLLNLPYQVKQQDTVKATYTYLADGTKLAATADTIVADIASIRDGIIYVTRRNGFDYSGSLVYTNNNGSRTLESIDFGGGRINKTGANAYDINYFITDHLGSTRVIVDNNGEIKEQKDFYPFGKEHENSDLITSTNRWGYNGKEKQTIKNLGWLDFSARMFANCEVPLFTTPDPLMEKYYSLSPYAFCGNNPINRIDPNGMNYDWVQNMQTDEYEWMDNVTSYENTPEGYKYVGESANNILSDMGVTTNYDEQYKKGIGFGLDGDENMPLGIAPMLPTNHTKGNITISANVSYNVENATENNTAGVTFDGISVTGNFIQPASQNQEGGNLFVSYGDKQYSSHLRYPTPGSSYIIQAGATLQTATVNIPASEISSSKVLSGASIKAAFANPALLRQVPYTEFNWNLQTRTSFRPLK